MASFEEILNKPASEIEPPKAYPVGTYHCLVVGAPETVKSSKKGTDGFRFKYRILSPKDDVDQVAFVEQQISGKEITDDMWVTEGSAFMLKNLLVDHLKIDPEGKTLRELVAEAPGRQLLVKLRHEPSQDGQRIYHRVDSTASV